MLVERMRRVAAPPEMVIAALTNVDNLPRLLQRAERVEVLQRSEGRARIAITVSAGKLGHQRVEGEARLLEDGMRFIAVTPTQMDVRWQVRAAAAGSEVTARVDVDLQRILGPLARLIGDNLIARQVSAELDKSFVALEELVVPPVVEQDGLPLA
ncbi:MAG: SRPBCC family protein [Herpetosiphonaceae bacterium]|nr:SRPBCC family protein [Herpetosiphonaceae bacterium]